MKVSPRGMFEIALDEGIVPTRYYDLANVPTVYIGHTSAAGAPNPDTVPLQMPQPHELQGALEEAYRVFERDIAAYAKVVHQKFGAMQQHEFDGWVSWHYNTGGAYSSSAVRKWRSGDKAAALRTLKSWNKVTSNGVKRVSQALVDRRSGEARLILTGRYREDDKVPVWGTNGRGKVDWSRPVARLSVSQFLELGATKGMSGKAASGIAAAIASLGAALALLWDKLF